MTDVPPPFEVGYVYLVQTSDLYKLGKTKNLANRVSQYRSGYPRAKCLFAREVLLHEMLSAEQALLAAANVAGLKKLHGRREWYEEPIPKELFLEVAEPYHRRFKDAYDLYTGVDLSRLFLDPGMAISAFAFIRELSQLGNDRSWDNRSKALALVLVYLSFAQLDRLVHERIALMPKWQKLELEETLRDFAQSFEVLYYGSRVAHLAFFRAFYRHWDRYTRDDIARYYVNIAFETVVTRNQELLSQAEEVYSFMAELDPEFFPLEELRTGSYYPYTSFTEVLEAFIHQHRTRARHLGLSFESYCYRLDLASFEDSDFIAPWLRDAKSLKTRELRAGLFALSFYAESIATRPPGYITLLREAVQERNIACPCGSGKAAKRCCIRKYGKKPLFRRYAPYMAHENGYSFPAEGEEPDVVADVWVRIDGTWELGNADHPVFQEFGPPPAGLIEEEI